MSIIAAAWKAAAELEVPMDATAAERLKARRLFYSGAFCMAHISTEAQKLSGLDYEQCIAVLNDELATFAATVHTPHEGKV